MRRSSIPNLLLPFTHSPLAFARWLIVIAALQIPLAPALQAQEGWDQVPVVSDDKMERSLSLGIEAGKPLIFGVKGSYNFDQRVSAIVGFSTLGDFAAITGEVRTFLLRFGVEKALPSVGVGFTQYFLSSGARETSPIAGHLLMGIEYIFPSYLGIGATLGYQHALGSSEDKTVERYDINDDLADWFFAVNARYFF